MWLYNKDISVQRACDEKRKKERQGEMKYYIAYGSNLNIGQMKHRCPDAKIIGTSMLKDWRLLFKGSKTGSYLTIEREAGGCVPIAVWAVSDRDEKKLDRYEGYPTFYYKQNMMLVNDKTGKLMDAFIYIMHEDRKIGVPSDLYVDTCLEGYRDFGFNETYLKKALKISCEEAN